MGASLALAFTAGLVATVNPCGIAMLPAYLAWLVGGDDGDDTAPGSLAAAARVGLVMSVGVVAVLAAAGIVISLGLRALMSVVPWLAIVVGVGLVVLGLRTLTGRSLPGLPQAARGPGDRSLRSVALFGASYAVASLSCTLPVFLAVIAGSSVQAGVVSSALTVLAYGLGMSALLIVLTIAVAVGRQALVQRVRASARWLTVFSGVVAVLAGVLLVWFWVVNLAAGNGVGAQTGVFPLVEQVSAALSNWLADAAAEVGVILAAVAAIVSVVLLVRRRADAPTADQTGADGAEARADDAGASTTRQ